MFFQRLTSEGLSHHSYMLGSGTEAFVIDPRRDCEEYAVLAKRNGFRITGIFETHRNEDYVIGSMELASLTGAPIFHSSGIKWGYGTTLKDGDRLKAGRLTMTAIRTPGHTDESMTYALVDESTGDANIMAFAGDALFVGEVGRTDLYGPEQTERLAGDMYRSLHERILPLGDGVILCPAHGGGSVCGARISERNESTVGIERLQNRPLGMGRGEFIAHKKAELIERPPYFLKMEAYNLAGPPLLGRLPSPQRLDTRAFEVAAERGAIIVDTRYPADFCGAHIEGAYSIWLEGLPEFAGWVLQYELPVILVLEDDRNLERAVRYLVRLGFDRIDGFLANGMEGWYDAGRAIETIESMSVHDLRSRLGRREKITVLDVRSAPEWQHGHIDGSLNIYIGRLEQSLDRVPRDRPVAVLCSVGRRASIGASILKRAGYEQVCNVLGSMTAWRAAGYPMAQ